MATQLRTHGPTLTELGRPVPNARSYPAKPLEAGPSDTTASQAADDNARTIAGFDTPSEASALIIRSIEIVD